MMAYVPTASDRATVRLLTGLSVDELPDDSIDALLVLNTGTVRYAAADGLEAFAGQLSNITADSDDIKIDTTNRTKVLLSRATSLRAQAKLEQVTASGAPVGVQTTGFNPLGRAAGPGWWINLPEPETLLDAPRTISTWPTSPQRADPLAPQ